MKKVVITLICVVIFGALCFEGYNLLCAKNNSKKTDSKVYEKLPEELKYESDHLKIDCQLEVPEGFNIDKLKRTTAKTIILSDYSDQIYATFEDSLQNTEYASEKLYDDEGIEGTQKLWSNVDPNTGIASMLNLFVSAMYYINPNASKSTIGQESLRVNEETGFYNDYPDGYKGNADVFKNDLGFETLDEAEKEVVEVIESWGLDGVLNCEAFGVSKDLVEKNYCYFQCDDTYITDIDKAELDQFEDYYQIYGRQALQGLPVIYYSQDGGGLYREQSPVKANISSQGIDYLEIKRLFNFTEEDEKITSLASEDQILHTVKNRYEDIVTENTFEISKGGLYYYALGNGNKKDFEMVPVWCFLVDEHDNRKGQVYESLFLINAETGKEMSYEP